MLKCKNVSALAHNCKLETTVDINIPYLAPSRDAMHVSKTVLVGLPPLV